MNNLGDGIRWSRQHKKTGAQRPYLRRTTLTGADELYHDEAFRAKASPFPPIFNVNNFLKFPFANQRTS
jgi:hypothetical protein